MFTFSLNSWAAWSPNATSYEDWCNWASRRERAEDDSLPNVKDIPMLLRRRLGRLGRMVIRTSVDVSVDGEEPYMVFSSRYGDSEATPSIMGDIANQTPISPARFSTSVHNSLAGLYAIHKKNTSAHTAIAAGKNSFLHALLEAQALLYEDPTRSVILVHYDEPLSEFFGEFVCNKTPVMAVALMIKGPVGDVNDMVMSCTSNACTTSEEDSALSFIRYLVGANASWTYPLNKTTWTCARHV